jgi:hypothetical protein
VTLPHPLCSLTLSMLYLTSNSHTLCRQTTGTAHVVLFFCYAILFAWAMLVSLEPLRLTNQGLLFSV